MEHIQKTKKQLVIVFLSTIIGIIVLLGVSFFSYRFFDGQWKDRYDTELLEIENASSIEKIIKDETFQLPRPTRGKKGGKFEKRSPLPFVVIFNSDGNIIHKNFGAEFEDQDFLREMYRFRFDGDFHTSFGIGKFYPSTQGESLLIFKPYRYPLHEFLIDIVVFLLFTVLFSLPLYFIIKYFVEKTVHPVEQNLKDMEEFVHNAGHELKTPLSVIHGDLQMMKTKKAYDTEFVDEMIAEIDKLNTLIEGLVDMSNIHANAQTEVLDVYTEIQHIAKTYEPMMEKKDITFKIEKHTEVTLTVNKGYFQIFVGNLISNAIKYNKQGGKIEVKINKQSFSIEDTGEGISEEHHTQIWQRFYKVKKGDSLGNGIGLSLVKKIADIYSWKIKIESKKGQFARFIVSIR